MPTDASTNVLDLGRRITAPRPARTLSRAAPAWRREVDGLRALAVLPVILFHAGFAPFAGGFVGVDVFFVISGYLITGLLLREMQAGTFSVLRFYQRRARRLLPALVVVLLATLPFALAWMTPEQLAAFAGSLAATALSVSNLWFWRDSGYFAAETDLMPLLHGWSLAVEEQFYLLFPLALLGLRRWRHGPLVGLALGAALSFGLCEWAWRNAPEANFYLAPTRAWELFAGGFCALLPAAGDARIGPLPRRLAGLAGLAMIAAAILLYDAATPFPSAHALLPVGGTLLVLRYATSDTPAGRLLALPPFVGLGLISYSAYLWHQPLLAFARLRSLDPPGPGLLLALSALSLGLAWATWRWIETPARQRRPARGAAAPAARSGSGWRLGAAAAVLASLVLIAALLPGLQAGAFDPPRLPELGAWRDRDPCMIAGVPRPDRLAACRASFAPGARPALLIGDSHAMAVSKALRAALAARGYRLITLAHNACYPIPGTTRLPVAESASCRRLVATAWEQTAAFPGAPVFLLSRWTLALDGRRFDNGQGGVETGAPGASYALDPEGQVAGRRDEALRIAALRDRTVTELAALARRHPVIVLGPFPEAGWDVPLRSARLTRFGPPGAAAAIGVPAPAVRARLAPLDPLFARLAAVPGVAVVALEPLFCDAAPGGICRQAEGGRIYYRDDDHPAPAAAALIAAAALSRL